ncbi:hypothetical protein PENSPDRAFT_647422 [Peniophora sp. CONT]|nr:hypothetical protein PENSPDRAFT_647422 [Peniophora sp. CONT]
MSVPPLPVGWTEHLAPTGHPYWYNAQTGQSTYVRPLPTFVNPTQSQVAQPATKEKPVDKTPIIGTPWTRVRTNLGNTFYTHKTEKRSVWTVPDEIKDAVVALDQQERERATTDEVGRLAEEAEKAVARQREVERIKGEMKGTVKRKAPETVPVDEVVVTKKAKVEAEQDAEEEGDDDDSEESEEEEWQREAAAQLAAEAEEERRFRDEEAKRAKEAEEAEAAAKAQEARGAKGIVMPEHVEMSIEEGKALFKTLLREKDINPLHPWDTALPLFISDPRYVLLPSVSARREAFDEYCRDRARELRQTQVKKEKEDPKEEFDRLLREEVTSTRTSWTDFRRKWKKDRRFYGWGRDEREREKRFREYIKELGEKKRLAAQKAEADFFALLRERDIAEIGAQWRDVKRQVSNDPRYDAVGSSSLREELFNTYLKANETAAVQESSSLMDVDSPAAPAEDAASKEQKRKERQERAVREREGKIRAERDRVEADIHKSKMGLTREEGESQFRTLLTDAIRDPQASWDSSLGELKTDPRFTGSPLPMNQQLHLFHEHVNILRSKQTQSLYGLFEAHASDLATRFSDLPLPSLLSSPPAVKLNLDTHRLEDLFERWQRERNNAARHAFDEMLRENAFVDFWGRLKHIGGEGADEGVQWDEDGMGEDEGEGGGGKVDMKRLAQKVDLTDVVKVLKNDKRYIVFDHVPEQRERWLRDYLSGLSAPKLSVHTGDS